MEGCMLSEILILLVLIFLNAFFAASEIAFISLNDNKVRHQAEEGDKRAKLIMGLLDEPTKFLSTIQIGITLAGFLASAFASETFAAMLTQWVKDYLPIPQNVIKTISMIIITVILSYFTLVLGELVPKRIGMKKSEAISAIAIYPILFLSKITSPFVKLLTLSTNFFLRLLGIDPEDEDEEVTEEEIRMMVDVGEEKGTIREEEREMINNIFEFDNKVAGDIMTHRTDIVAVPIDSSLEEVLKVISEEGYTRVPVYEETIDNIVGIINAKDILRFIQNGGGNFSLKNILRKPVFIPASKKVDELFSEMKKTKTHMVIIIDEYGGTAGIVTSEDLLEEIVGNIQDEYDEEEPDFTKIDDNTFIIDGLAQLDLVCEYLDVDLPVEDYETLNGFLLGLLGRIPEEGEKPVVEYENLTFKIEDVCDKRVTKVKVYKS